MVTHSNRTGKFALLAVAKRECTVYALVKILYSYSP